MRLKSLWIDDFKNLKNFKIDFEKREGITVLIGNNASGKSNLLEAISAIFAGVYSDELDKLGFKFDLVYEAYNLDIRISKKIIIKYRFKKSKNKAWKLLDKLYSFGSRVGVMRVGDRLKSAYDFRPSQVIALYSGEELRLWEDYYQKSYFNFFNILKKQKSTDTPKLLYINKYVWNIALITLLCKEKYYSFIKDLLDIEPQDGLDIKFDIDDSKYAGFEDNPALELVRRIVIEQQNNNGLINTKTLASFDINGQAIKPKQIFQYLYTVSSPTTKNQQVKIDKIVTNVKVNIGCFSLKGLSEGQKKQILLKLALDVLADENTLILFDEPDAHIHIANKKLIPEMLKDYDNREIIFTTHSPTLAHLFDSKHLAYLENGKINEEYNTQEKLLNELTNGLMGVSEQQIFLQSNKDILIVEGKTDEAYIAQALKILKKDNKEYKKLDFNFLWLGGTDADTLKKVITEFNPKQGQTIIAFLDSDSSGHECIKKVLNITTEKKDFIGQRTKKGICIHFYPKKPNFDKANFEVEDYFPIEVLRSFCIKETETFQGIKSKFDKVKFAKKCMKDDFKKSNFDDFKTLFDKIIEIKLSGSQ